MKPNYKYFIDASIFPRVEFPFDGAGEFITFSFNDILYFDQIKENDDISIDKLKKVILEITWENEAKVISFPNLTKERFLEGIQVQIKNIISLDKL